MGCAMYDHDRDHIIYTTSGGDLIYHIIPGKQKEEPEDSSELEVGETAAIDLFLKEFLMPRTQFQK